MAGFLPFLTFLVIFLIFFKHSCLNELPKREVILISAVIIGALCIVSTEVLSFFNGIGYPAMTGFWVLTFLFCIFFYLRERKNSKRIFINKYKQLDWLIISIFSAITVILVLIAIVAFKSPPNTWDALTCHLPRVSHWIQNHNVGVFPTTMFKQLHYLPGASYIILHLNVLTNSDVLANGLQYFSLVGSIIGVSLLAKYLGANRLGQCLAGLIAVTIPMAILQGSSSQNDLVVSFWIICFTVFIFRLQERPDWLRCILAGLSLGLAYSIKGTGYLYTFPVLVWLGWFWLKNRQSKNFKWFLLIVIIAGSIVMPFYLRNVQMKGDLFGGEQVYSDLQVKEITPKLLFSNIVRNVGVHLGTNVDGLNIVFKKGVVGLHNVLDIDMNDPRSTFSNEMFHFPITTFEDGTGQFTHLIVLWIGMGIFLINLRQRKNEHSHILFMYLAMVTAAFLLFCGFVKYTPHCTRYHLPLFMLMAPFLGAVFEKVKFKRVIIIFLCLCLISSAFPFIFRNTSRRLISKKKATIFNTPRDQRYFQNDTNRYMPYYKAVNFVKSKGFNQIGLLMQRGDWEYPLFALLKSPNNSEVRIEHVETINAPWLLSKSYPLGAFYPEAIIQVNGDGEDHIVLASDTIVYYKYLDASPVRVYVRGEK